MGGRCGRVLRGRGVDVPAAESAIDTDSDSAATEITVTESESVPASDRIDGTSPGPVPEPSVTQRHGCRHGESPQPNYNNRCVPWHCQYGRTSYGTCEPKDPRFRYHTLTCSSYSTDADAAAYLDMDPDHKNDRAVCPPPGMFLASPGTDDWPVWGFQENVADDYGKIVVEQSGECSGPKDDWGIDFPDTGTIAMAIGLEIIFPWGLGSILAFLAENNDVILWDFQMPCKAHDHCFDLIRAGLSGTVTINDCDDRMHELMEADYNNRKFLEPNLCSLVGSAVYDAVKAFSKAAPDPGLIRLVNPQTGLCADIDRSVLPNGQLSDGVADGTKVLQWPCRTSNANNQQFRLRPASFPGFFEIVPEHSSHLDKCITAVATLFLTTCDSEPSGSGERIGSSRFQSFEVVSTGIDRYTISGKEFSGKCWTIPSIDTSVIPRRGTGLTNAICSDSFEGAYQIWRIDNV